MGKRALSCNWEVSENFVVVDWPAYGMMVEGRTLCSSQQKIHVRFAKISSDLSPKRIIKRERSMPYFALLTHLNPKHSRTIGPLPASFMFLLSGVVSSDMAFINALPSDFLSAPDERKKLKSAFDLLRSYQDSLSNIVFIDVPKSSESSSAAPVSVVDSRLISIDLPNLKKLIAACIIVMPELFSGFVDQFGPR